MPRITIPTAPKSSDVGQSLQQQAFNGTERVFIERFIPALQGWAAEIGIPNPTAITGLLHKSRVRVMTGASEAQLTAFYTKVRDELGCDKVYQSGPTANIGDMARFYYRQLHGHTPRA